MHYRTLLLLILIFAAASTKAEDPPKEATEKSVDEPLSQETLGKVRLTLDPGGHTNDIHKVLFTPDGKQLVTGSLDGTVRIWDVQSGETVRVLRFPGRPTSVVPALSPDGRLLAVNGHYSENKVNIPVIFLLTLADGHIERILKGHTGAIKVLAFTPDGKHLASGAEDKTIRVWSLEKDAPPEVIQNASPVLGIAFSPDGKRFVQSSVKGFGIRDLGTGKVVPLRGGTLPLLGWCQGNVAWSRDGKTVATCAEDGLRLWEPDGKLRLYLLEKVHTRMGGFSPNSRRIFVETEKRIAVFDVRAGKNDVAIAPKGAFSFFWNGTFSPDGQLIATSTAGETKAIFLWKASNGDRVKRLGASIWLYGPDIQAGWSADSKTVSWKKVAKPEAWKGGPTTFQPGDLQFGPILPPDKLRGITLQKQKGTLSLRHLKNETVEVVKNGKVLSTLKLPAPYQYREPMTLVNKDRAVICGNGYGFFLYDTNTGKLIRRVPHRGWVLGLAPSPNGRYILSVAEDQKLHIWDADQGRPLLTLYVSGRDWIAWTNEGYYAASPGGERLMGWHVDNGPEQLASFYPADRFRKQLYRPDVIKLVLEKGSVEEALTVANAALQKEGVPVNKGVADLQKMLPPKATLKLVNKNDEGVVTLAVEAKAAAKEQPIASLRLLVDGRPFHDKNASENFEKGAADYKKSWTVTLPPGQHHVVVLARSADASSISNEMAIDCRPATEKPVLHVLAVGITRYEDKALNLGCAADDAELIAKTFQTACKGELYREVRSRTLLNETATRTAFMEAIQALRTGGTSKVKANDLVVVFFAGHGAKEKDQFYLLTHEAKVNDLAGSALSGRQLRNELKEFPCQVLLMMDACQATGFGEKGKLAQKNLQPATDEATRAFTDDEVGVAVMCAAMGYEKAEEGKGNGLFTKWVVAALTDNTDVPFNHENQKQYVHHLQSYVFDKVSTASMEKQHPFLHLPWTVESFALRQLPLTSKP